MPRGNRTGPAGAGPMTGRKAGFCAGNTHAGWESGPGGPVSFTETSSGRGRRRREWRTAPYMYQAQTLKANDIEEELSYHKARIEKLEHMLQSLEQETDQEPST